MRTSRLAIWAVWAALLAPVAALAQNGNINGTTFSSTGRPAGGVNVAICSTLTTTAAAVASNVATLTFASNPVTQGFVIGGTLSVTGFTGGDTYFNGSFTIAATSSSTISYSLSHANASASSNGTVSQAGTVTQACAPLTTLFTDNTGNFTSPNPFTSDGLGNYTAWTVPGYYKVQTYGANYGNSVYATGVACVPSSSVCGSITGTIAVNQVGFGTGSNVFGGSANFLYNTSGTPNAVALNMPGASCTGLGVNQHGCALVTLTNSSASTPFYIGKQIDNSIIFVNSDEAIPTHGWFGYDTRGNYFNISGGTGTQMQLLGAAGGILPAGSVLFQMPENGLLTTEFVINQPSNVSNAGAWEMDGGTGRTSWFPTNSIVATATFTPPASGSSTVMSAVQCGTVTAGGACANTATTNAHCVSGIATLSGGTSTITGISPAFTSSSSWFVITNDLTTIANPSKGVPASASSITFTGTGTDNIAFIGCGG